MAPQASKINEPHQPSERCDKSRIQFNDPFIPCFKESRVQHILARKHNIGYEELRHLKEIYKPENLKMERAKYSGESFIDHYEGAIPSGKIIHLEVLVHPDGCKEIMDAWVPNRDCNWCKDVNQVGALNPTKDMKAQGTQWDQRREVRRFRDEKGQFAKDPRDDVSSDPSYAEHYKISCMQRRRRGKSLGPQKSPNPNHHCNHRRAKSQEFKGLNKDGELYVEKRRPSGAHSEKITYSSHKVTDEGTLTKEYENDSPVTSDVGHSRKYVEIISKKGQLFKTVHHGKAELSKDDHSVKMVDIERTSYALRDEVKGAFDGGAQAGISSARRVNESRLFLSTEDKVQAACNASQQMLTSGSDRVADLLARERGGNIGGAAYVAAKEAVATGSVTDSLAAAGFSVAQGLATEKGGKLGGAAFAGAKEITQGGSLEDGLIAAGERLIASTVIRERDRIGLELPGNNMVSAGSRYKSGETVDKHGTKIISQQEETGIQFRKALDHTSGAVGIGGNIGCTTTTKHELNNTSWTTSERWVKDELRGVKADVDFAGIPWLNLDTGSLKRKEVRNNLSLIQGSFKKEESQSIKALGLSTMVLSMDTVESADCFLFNYKQRASHYERWGTSAEHVQLPFIQYSRIGQGTLDKDGQMRLQHARLTSVSLSETSKLSLQRTANLVSMDNSHNRDADLGTLGKGLKKCMQVAIVDELHEGFTRAMRARGCPTQQISIAYEYVAKPLWQAYRESGDKGFAEHVQKNLQIWLAQAGAQLQEHPVEFLIQAVNTVAPLVGTPLNIQWDADYKGLRLFGYGAGIGTQVDIGQDGYVRDEGLHASARISQTFNIVGASACIGKSTEALKYSSDDGKSKWDRQGENYGVRAKGDILGVEVADARVGHMRFQDCRSQILAEGNIMKTISAVSSTDVVGCEVRAGLPSTGQLSVVCGAGTDSTTKVAVHTTASTSSSKQVEYETYGIIAKAGGIGKLCGFGVLDLSTGILHGVHTNVETESKGCWLAQAKREWSTRTCTTGVSLMGLKLEIPITSTTTSEHSLMTCGIRWYRRCEIHENMFNRSTATSMQTFFMLVEVEEKRVNSLFGEACKSFQISATPELKGILGMAVASSIGTFYDAMSKGSSASDAIQASLKVFQTCAAQSTLDLYLSCMAANISECLASLSSHDAWQRFQPYLSDSVAALVRPIVTSCLRGGFKIEDFGKDWLKQFIQLQLVRILHNAGVGSASIQLVSAAFPRIFDNIASGNPDIFQLLVDLAPILLETGLKIAVSGGPHGWVLAYIVVPLLIQIFKTQAVHQVLGHVQSFVKDCARSVWSWVRHAMEKLKEFFREIGVSGVVAGIAAAGVVGGAAAASASAALTPTATVVGSQALGSMAVSMGLMAAPVAPVGAVLGIASVAGLATGVVTMVGYREAKRLIKRSLEEHGSWRQRMTDGTEVEIFIRQPRRQWVCGVVILPKQASVAVKFGSGDTERVVRCKRDSETIRLQGADGAIAEVAESAEDEHHI